MTFPEPDNGLFGESFRRQLNRRRALLVIGGMALTSVGAAALIPGPQQAARGAGRAAGHGPAAGLDPAAAASYREALTADFNRTTTAVRAAMTAREAAARHPAYPLNQPLEHIADNPAKAIALTIDDGPSPVYTPQVLQLLAQYRVTATFSMIGTQVAAYPQLVRKVADAGHVIANHTWTHANLPGLSAPNVASQMTRASAAIQAAAGAAPRLFRAPYGAWSPAVIQQCERMQMVPLDWSVDPRDWSRPGVASIVSNIMANTRPGSIILEHDGGGNRSQTVAALRIVLPRLLAAGFRFETP
jgi:peptidoglycan-N-acetylglucosamine deacetylase